MKPIRSIIAATFLLTACAVSDCAPRVASVSEYSKQSFDPRGLITLNDPKIQESLKTILSDGDDVRTDFRRIEDWVAANVAYDSTVGDNWQLPADTLNTRKGDCKDYSTLLCTLWRASGIPSSDVYVAIGQGKAGPSHAFIIEKHMNGTWQVVEPQVGGLVLSELSAVDTAEKYAITFLFNDVEYINTPSSILQKVRGGTVTSVAKPIAKPPLPKINLFTSDRSTLPAGESTKLNWDVSGATYIGIDQGIGSVSPAGTCTISPTDTAEYRLVATNSAGSVMASLSVRVLSVAYSQPMLPSMPGTSDDQGSFMIGFDGWYADDHSVQMANVGQLITARFNLKGGTAGQYITRVWRALASGHDEILTQWSFIYDGVAAAHEISFSPAYAIGDSDTRGYWVDLLGNGEQVWVMPNSYPPRLIAIPKPATGPLSVGFIGWYIGGNAVSSARVGQEISTGITLAGGDEGKYVLHVKRDTVGVNDESVGEIAFVYDGTSAMQNIEFSPQYATQEAGTRGYYLDLYKDGKYLWSLGGSSPPRLTVKH